jgi:putative flippase GtrA
MPVTVLRQFSRFGLIGVISTVVHVVVGLALNELAGMNAFWANLVAFCCALGVSYLGQTRLTFPESTADGPAFTRFVAVTIVGLTLNQVIVWVTTSFFGGPYRLALAIVVIAVPAVTVPLLKYWALRR